MKGLKNEQIVKALEAGFEVRTSAWTCTSAIETEEVKKLSPRSDAPFWFKCLDIKGEAQRYFCVALFDVIEVKASITDTEKVYITNNGNDLTIWRFDKRGFFEMVDWLDFEDYKTQMAYMVRLTQKLIKCL